MEKKINTIFQQLDEPLDSAFSSAFNESTQSASSSYDRNYNPQQSSTSYYPQSQSQNYERNYSSNSSVTIGALVSSSPATPLGNIRTQSGTKASPAVSYGYSSYTTASGEVGNVTPTVERREDFGNYGGGYNAAGSESQRLESQEREAARLSSQLQLEKSNNDLANKRHNYLVEERSALNYQIQNLENQNHFLRKSLDQHNQIKQKSANDISKLEAEKATFLEELDRERANQEHSSAEMAEVKNRFEQSQKQLSAVSAEYNEIKAQHEKDMFARVHLEKENNQRKEKWNEMQKQLESQEVIKVTLAKEVQDLKKQIRQNEQIQATILDLQAKRDLLEQKINEEQLKRKEVEKAYYELSQKYQDLDRRKATFDNLGLFSEKLMTNIPAFQSQVTAVQQTLSEIPVGQRTSGTADLFTLITELKNSTQSQLQKNEELIAHLTQSIEKSKF